VYTAEFSNAFKKSYKKLVKQDKDLGEDFAAVVKLF
jgi:mRNA-degrading endonuclease YafQ of YafQ-DinJ toxin-antitoxin module